MTLAGGLRLAVRKYSENLWMDRHAHGEWRFCLPVHGAYTDSWRSESRTRTPGMLSLHPPDEVHTTRFHSAATCFHVGFSDPWTGRLLVDAGIEDGPHEFIGGRAASVGTQMYDEFRRGDRCSHLVLEGLALELIGWTGRARLSTRGPAWVYTARDLVHDRFSESLQMKDVAEAVRVHPVRLARQFRKEFGMTLGAYVRHLRVAYVRQRLNSDASLADLAAAAGFADQSHMTRIFKRLTGKTPARDV